jgi:hypothetical protein
MQDITELRVYPAYCADIALNLSLLFLVLLCNLYLVFVAGAGAQDMLAKLVILNFITSQQPRFKQKVFRGQTGKIVLQAIRKAYELGPTRPVPQHGDGRFISACKKQNALASAPCGKQEMKVHFWQGWRSSPKQRRPRRRLH